MELIHHPLTSISGHKTRVELAVDRLTLAKRRWRGMAGDGRDFGFDLERPLEDGAAFFETEEHLYIVKQQPEPVLELQPGEGAEAARTGWMIGNLHFPIGIENGLLLAPDDPAVRQLLEREHIHYTAAHRVFHPLKAAAAHHHHHHAH